MEQTRWRGRRKRVMPPRKGVGVSAKYISRFSEEEHERTASQTGNLVTKTYLIAADIYSVCAEVIFRLFSMVSVLIIMTPYRKVVAAVAIITVNTNTCYSMAFGIIGVLHLGRVWWETGPCLPRCRVFLHLTMLHTDFLQWCMSLRDGDWCIGCGDYGTLFRGTCSVVLCPGSLVVLQWTSIRQHIELVNEDKWSPDRLEVLRLGLLY